MNADEVTCWRRSYNAQLIGSAGRHPRACASSEGMYVTDHLPATGRDHRVLQLRQPNHSANRV
jgi:hypothetical protein